MISTSKIFWNAMTSDGKVKRSLVSFVISQHSMLVDGSVVEHDHLSALDRVEAVGVAPGEHERAALHVSASQPKGIGGCRADEVAAHQFTFVAVTPHKLSRLSRIDVIDDRREIVAPHPRRHDDERQKREKTDWLDEDDLHCCVVGGLSV